MSVRSWRPVPEGAHVAAPDATLVDPLLAQNGRHLLPAHRIAVPPPGTVLYCTERRATIRRKSLRRCGGGRLTAVQQTLCVDRGAERATRAARPGQLVLGVGLIGSGGGPWSHVMVRSCVVCCVCCLGGRFHALPVRGCARGTRV